MILNGKISDSKQIKITRDSVCMGDDVNAPNADFLDLNEKDMLSDVFKKVEKYLPKMSDVVWAVDSGRTVLGYIIMDKDKNSAYEICQPDNMFSEMKIKSLHCSYFHSQSRNAGGIENVKRCMQERFQYEFLIEKGSLCFWGEWFGRPHDNIHIIESIKYSSTELVIHFDKGETLYITDPEKIVNEENKLIIGDASKVLFVWYYYGKEQTYENLYVRQYIKNADGKILRAEGKRRDVSSSGTAFFPESENAVCIIA